MAGAAKGKRAASTYPKVEVTSRAALRRWFEAHHAASKGAWVVLPRKSTGRARVTAVDVAEEAICFGWVDSLPRALDGAWTMLLVTPRRARANWSRINRERAERLMREGRMAPSGLAAVERAKGSGTWTALDEVEDLVVPRDLAERFARAPAAARANFEAFPRSVRRAILEWILGAKRTETRERRIEETVTLAARNVRANQWRQPGGAQARGPRGPLGDAAGD